MASGNISEHKIATCPCPYCTAAREKIVEGRELESWETREEDGVIIRGQPS